MIGQIVRHPKDMCAGQEIHVLRPAAEEVGRLGAGERVTVVAKSGAEGQKSYWESFHGDVTVNPSL